MYVKLIFKGFIYHRDQRVHLMEIKKESFTLNKLWLKYYKRFKHKKNRNT